jgi:hypothetical protein
VNQISVTRNQASYFLAEIRVAHKSLLDRLEGEISVATVNHFEVSDVGVTCTYPVPYLSIGSRLYLMKWGSHAPP